MQCLAPMRAVLVTGATDGIGQATSEELVRQGAHVILHGRSHERLAATKARLEALNPEARLETICADFAMFEEVERMADALLERHSRLDGLINNAGVYMNERMLTADGFESTFQVNHLAHFLLTHRLLDLLRASDDGRIIHVSSIAHTRACIHFDDLDGQCDFNGYLAYAQSKLANVLFSAELVRCLGLSPTSNALHPGVVDTKLLNDGMGACGFDSLEKGAATSVMLVMAPEARGITGQYYSSGQPNPCSKTGEDPEVARRLYEISAERVGITPLSRV